MKTRGDDRERERECRRSLQFITEIKVKASTDLRRRESIIREREREADRERSRRRRSEMTIMEKEGDGRM